MGKDIELAILFADVVGSTRIYEVMGDLRARDMVLTCVEIMRAATEQNHGTVIKTIGDEIMATFPTANDALNAASRMQHDIRIHQELKVEGQPIAIRIGGHFGPVVLENRDIFSAAVHTANRMTSQAKAGQIMITSAMVERLAPEWQSAVRQIDVATLKGKTSEDELFEVLWQKEDATSMLPAIALGNAASREKQRVRRLRVRFQGEEIVVDDSRTNIAIGRAEGDGRQHAGRILLLPEHLVELVFARLTLEGCHIDLAHRRRPLGGQPRDHGARDHDLAGLGLARHAICGVDRGAEDIPVLEHDRTEMTADAYRNRLTLDPQLRMNPDVVLHPARRVERVVGRRERRHDLVADRLDHRAAILLGRSPHDLDARENHVARTQVSHDFVDPRAAHHVGEQYG